MPAIFPTRPLFVVDAGPYSGVYFSREDYERRLEIYKPPVPTPHELPTDIFEQDPWLDEGGGG